MGAFKPLLPFGDSTVIDTCLDSLRDAGVEQIVVVLGHRGDEIREHLVGRDVTFAFNSDPDAPMSASIARGIEQLKEFDGCVLVTPVDHVAVPTDTIAQIIREWRTGQSLVQPEHGGRGGHPVLIDLRYRAELLDLDPAKGLRGLLEQHRADVRRLPVDSPLVARDMDTWEDYLAVHREVFGHPPRQD